MSANAFSTLRARAALAGFALIRTDPADGPVQLFLMRHGRHRELATMDDLEALIGYQEERIEGLNLWPAS